MRTKIRTIICFLCICTAASAQVARDNSEIQREMPKIYHSIIEVYGLAAKTSGFKDKSKQGLVEQNLKSLVEAADRVQEHSKARMSAVGFAGRFLANDARRAYENWRRGNYTESQFNIRSMVDNCIACHSALPSQQNSKFAADVFTAVQDGSLSDHERARLLVATRQFDLALGAYESVLTGGRRTESSVISLDPFIEYLTLCIRVKSDLIRPKKTLLNVLESPILPAIVRQDLKLWVDSLTELSGSMEMKKNALEIARGLIAKARARMEYPSDRSAVVWFLQASALLQEFLEGDPRNPDAIAEAYYLLGTTELLVGRDYWLSHADNYLEAAIRAAPGSKHAPRAFALLEENALLEYGGDEGGGLPLQARERLENLRKMLDTAPSSKTGKLKP